MSNASFTRDEVILTLDVLYSSGDDRLSKSSPAISDLCNILQTLPIHSEVNRPENFRNTDGVSDQIRSFRQEVSGFKGTRWAVGKIFHEVAKEFQGRTNELHEIAVAIRRNKAFFNDFSFGHSEENIGFPEGALLSHLHRVIERRDSIRLSKEKRCAICKISMERIYNNCNDSLDFHLLIPVVQLDASKRYLPENFVTVCPNCHAALHQYRPWRVRENMNDILR